MFEWIVYYCVALMFGFVSAVFFVYAVKHSEGDVQTILLYGGIGTFFGAITLAMFFKNGALVQSLVALLLGGVMVMAGIHMISGVIKHNIRTEATLLDKHMHRSQRGSYHFSLDFRIPDSRDTYTVDYVSSDRKYKIGNKYKIYISEKDHEAYVHRPIWFILGLFCGLMGLGFLWMLTSLVPAIISNH